MFYMWWYAHEWPNYVPFVVMLMNGLNWWQSLLAQISLYVHKGCLKPHSVIIIFGWQSLAVTKMAARGRRVHNEGRRENQKGGANVRKSPTGKIKTPWRKGSSIDSYLAYMCPSQRSRPHRPPPKHSKPKQPENDRSSVESIAGRRQRRRPAIDSTLICFHQTIH